MMDKKVAQMFTVFATWCKLSILWRC